MKPAETSQTPITAVAAVWRISNAEPSMRSSGASTNRNGTT